MFLIYNTGKLLFSFLSNWFNKYQNNYSPPGDKINFFLKETSGL